MRGLRDVVENLRAVVVQDQDRLYAIEAEQYDLNERMRGVESNATDWKLASADHHERLRGVESKAPEIRMQFADH